MSLSGKAVILGPGTEVTWRGLNIRRLTFLDLITGLVEGGLADARPLSDWGIQNPAGQGGVTSGQFWLVTKETGQKELVLITETNTGAGVSGALLPQPSLFIAGASVSSPALPVRFAGTQLVQTVSPSVSNVTILGSTGDLTVRQRLVSAGGAGTLDATQALITDLATLIYTPNTGSFIALRNLGANPVDVGPVAVTFGLGYRLAAAGAESLLRIFPTASTSIYGICGAGLTATVAVLVMT